ncbi:MAG: DUF1295 domain-containing protein [Candidatus Azotimanducaceae bacterium]|uniref:DUF1295 domain-containing protein n=1 Tax=OM182 bacterium TaxID=2510334 RepID=A0A520RXQ3_9GAMM|nr:hypothetical protein [Gammaproteobacteria bacterium]OUV68031.1 MAG: hypothetical protein CBC93_03400 [Gammaproteobacteria bacterium TMED133]RZO74971.1 MAG: DUF1295 domain-containing protein [OM182 bacterium]
MALTAKAWIVIFLSPLIALGLVWVSGRQGVTLGHIPVFDICIFVTFLAQWVLFAPAYIFQTEHYFDLSGSVTYVGVITLAWLYGSLGDVRSSVISILVILWAVRLGSFLFTRVKRKGSDSRFTSIKPNFPVYLMTWTLQALWVSITASCALIAITTSNKIPFDGWAGTGLIIWVSGFLLEVIADYQKQKFRAEAQNAQKFINRGLWSWSRHPNYLGEMLLWFGIAIMAFPVLAGWQFVTLASPVFVCYLLTKVSGIEMLERQNDISWGSDPDYWAYKNSTPVLLPFLKMNSSKQT